METDLSRFAKFRILVIGDLMMDEYVWGEVDRISPEAPVQVVSVLRDTKTLGGAGNVVNNLVSLGAGVAVAGVIGTGYNGARMLKMFKDLKVDTAGLLQDPARPTTKKTRIIAGHQHVLRIDYETKTEISDGHAKKVIQLLGDRIERFDAILLSDYGKGLLCRALLRQVIEIAQEVKKPVIVDPKGLDFRKYAGATLITPNRKEASLALGVQIVDENSLRAAGEGLLRETGVERILITCGKDGMALFEKGKEPVRIPARVRQVFDVSGAGDTVLAVVGLGLASGMSFLDAATMANTAAGIVVGKVGTAAVSREELRRAIDPSQEAWGAKHRSTSDLIALSARLRTEGQTIVMTNGCFDLLHVGHIKLLSDAKKMGDALIVAIDDDDSVQMLKGPGRPIIGAQERVRIISALDCVDFVTLFSTNELEGLVEAIRPHILVKGSNYTTEAVIGRDIVKSFGGHVALIPITEPVSSSQIIERIKERGP
jgi:D-beta-D-heptose 7-phosphate kinase/D-beta-D-heptose 1-phosphate adenosyltransferase